MILYFSIDFNILLRFPNISVNEEIVFVQAAHLMLVLSATLVTEFNQKDVYVNRADSLIPNNSIFIRIINDEHIVRANANATSRGTEIAQE